MIGIVTREVVKDPKKDVAAAILPNGRVLVNPDWVRNPENSEEYYNLKNLHSNLQY